MLIKFLLTFLIIIGAALWLRRRDTLPHSNQAEKKIKWLSIGLVGSMLFGAGLYFYHRWSKAHQILIIQTEHQGQISTYRVYRQDFYTINHFKTVDGIEIRLASDQKIEMKSK